ncbi:MAG: NAD(P)-dependent oxidoreductase [Gemmatimonadaceae bacterium]
MKSSRSPFWHTRVLVLGASGFVGYWVARALRAQGAHVTCAVRTVEGAERLTRQQLGSVVVRRDLADLGALGTWIPPLKPAIVFNLAGYGVDRSEQDEETADLINHRVVGALARVVSALPADRWEGVRMVHVGSALEYGETGGELSETSPCAPTTLYGRTKLAGTEALQQVSKETGLEACVARLFTLYGPGEHAGRLLPSLMAAASGREPLDLTDGVQRRDFTYVEDAAEGLMRLAVSDVAPGQVVNLCSGTLQTVRSFAEIAASLVGLTRERLRFGALPARPEETPADGVSVTRLRQLTRWSASDDIAEGIGRTMGRLAEHEFRDGA